MVSSISVTTKSALVRAPKTMPSTVTSFCPKSGIMKLGPVGDSREHCTTIFIARVSETEVIVGSDSRVTRFKKKSQIVTEDQLHKYRIFGSVMITCSGSLSRFDKAMKFLTETLNSRTKARTKRYDVKNIINVLKDFFRRRREDDDDDEDDDEDDDDDDDDDDDVDDNPGGDPGVLEDTCTLHVIGWIKSEMRCGIFRVGDHYKDANEVKDKICGSGSGYFIAEHLFQSSNLDLNCENIVKILAMTSVYDTYTGGALRAFSLREGADVVVYKPVDLIHALLPSMDRNITHNVFIPSGLFIVIQFHDQTKLTRKNLIDMMTRVILTHDFSTSVNIVTNTSRSLLVYYLKIRCFDHRQLMLDHFGLLGKLKYPRFVTYVKGASRCNFLIGSAKKVFLENVGRARTLGELFRLKSVTIKRAIKKRNAARHARIQMAHPGAALQGCDIVGALKVTKDGVTVAKAIEFKDRVMNVGANLVKQVANATNDVARDGTTCATILTRAIYAEGCKSVAAGMNAMDLRCGINMAVDYVVTNLKSRARMISTSEEIAQVGTIFVNGDREIGELIAKAMERVGIDGVITIGDGNLLSNELEVLEGMKLDRGYISPQFITNQKNQKCELEDVLILIHEKKIESTVSLVKVLELAYNKQKPLLIVSEDLGSEVLGLILNKLRVGLKVCAIKAPGFGENKKAYLEDLAVLTGGEVITSELGINLEDVTVDTLGSCKKVTVSKDDTIILDGAGNKKSIEERCEQLRSGIELSTSDYDKEKLQERLAKLSGGVAVLKIGGASESEVGEKKDRVTDALNATKAAVEEGIVPGGGVALLYASKELDKLETANFDQKIGVQIIQNAVKVLYTIALNAGVEGAVVVGKLLEQDNPDLGYDASKGDYVDMVKAGIIDPLKVIKSALVDAASVSSLLTTTEAVIVTVIKDLKYSESHEWVKVEGTSATVGITDHAQDHLGDVVYVELPEEGIHVKQNESFGAVESVKAASIINSPISGKVVGVNTQLNESPGLVNGSPYEKGWIIKVEIEDASELNHLMDSDLYSKFCEEENANH